MQQNQLSCCVGGCRSASVKRGLCLKHYQKARRLVLTGRMTWGWLVEFRQCLEATKHNNERFTLDEIGRRLEDGSETWHEIAAAMGVGLRTVARVASRTPGRRRRRLGQHDEGIESGICDTCGYRVPLPCVGCRAKGVTQC
jgi:hypothetical protein